jgi:quercetin dioxygenase-like cupin family protein
MIQFVAKAVGGETASWKVLSTTEKSQAAMMSLGLGEVSGEYGTDHPQADQWLYCLSGSGSATVEGREITFSAGDLLLIEAGEKHQLRGGPCRTLNFYSPAAYPDEA